MKKSTREIFGFAVGFLVLLYLVMMFLKIADTNTLISIKGLSYEMENEHDVIFMGQSDVYTGYIPTQAWKEHQYSSFAYGLSAMPATMFPSMLDEINKKQHPKVLVVEMTAFTKDDAYYLRTAERHSFIDNLPLGKNRLRTIMRNVPKDEQMEYFRLISTYHNNWKLPSVCRRTSFVRIMNLVHRKSILKGYSSTAGINRMKPGSGKSFVFTKRDEEYLKNFMAHCRELGYENVLFVRFPHATKIKNKKALAKIEKVITDGGYDFLNLNSEFKILDLSRKKDFYSNEHLNLRGAEKLTTYLGNYLTTHYDLTPRTDKAFIKRWNDNCKEADKILEYGHEELSKKSRKRVYEFSLHAEKLSQIFSLSSKK